MKYKETCPKYEPEVQFLYTRSVGREGRERGVGIEGRERGFGENFCGGGCGGYSVPKMN